MKINSIYTPAVLVDLDVLENNLQMYENEAARCRKQLWPMLKTHKSLELAKEQMKYGATGFLCGTLDEAEALCEAGIDNLMYAYPVAADSSVKRVVALAQKCRFIARVDGVEAAEILNEGARKAGVTVDYTVIIDSGLHRFGIAPESAGAFVKALSSLKNLRFVGISTHPGHVYGISFQEGLDACVGDECSAVKTAAASLETFGFVCEILSSGSTPTYFGSINDANINIYHPGNYIFHDVFQLSLGTAKEADCALFVLASVISHPQKDLFICDAGAKCLGLDQGAHGNASIVGDGTVIGHPELTITGLSEEVGKIHVNGTTSIKVGDIIKIIPNHACSSANLTSYYIGMRGEAVDHAISVDMRGNATTKNIFVKKPF